MRILFSDAIMEKVLAEEPLETRIEELEEEEGGLQRRLAELVKIPNYLFYHLFKYKLCFLSRNKN